jgi:hypothetical protein
MSNSDKKPKFETQNLSDENVANIVELEKKILHEKQFNRQVKLNGELKRLLAELGEVSR